MTEEERLVIAAETSIQQALDKKSGISIGVLMIDGMSSPKVRHFFNNLIYNVGEARYLEVGLWKGSTFVSALYNNNYKYAVGIEDFSQFGSPKEECLKNIKEYLRAPNSNTEVIIKKFQEVSLDKKFNIYFYDGEHTVPSQMAAFEKMNDNLDDVFVTIVDDWNWDGVRSSTWNVFNKLGYRVVRFWELYAQSGIGGDLANWWNGLFVAVIKKGV